METTDVFREQFQTMEHFYQLRLADLRPGSVNRPGDLDWRPAPQANSLGFTLWHLLRIWDGYLCLLDGQAETYAAEGWPARFGFDPSGRGIAGTGMGTGFTPADVDVVRPSAEGLAGYFDALRGRTSRFLTGVPPAALAQEISVPWWNQPTTAAGVLTYILTHSLLHLGEAEFLRGLLAAREP